MKIEEQVISLIQAKRLHELGVNAPSIFEHIYTPIHTRGGKLDFTTRVVLAGTLLDSDKSKYYPAYTVAELGEMLPDSYHKEQAYSIRDIGIYEGKEINGHSIFNFDTNEIIILNGNHVYPTEAQARAEYIIYLLENKLHSL